MRIKPIKVLCCADYFLPGFAGGGPIRTIANMRDLLGGDVDLAVFTRDRDLGASDAFGGIPVDAWHETEDGRIFYASPDNFGVPGLMQVTERERFDLLYLNSFFSSRSSIRPYVWSRCAYPELPILLAPRGEFSPGALTQKRMKKRAFLALSRTVGLYRDIAWHASSETEKADILRQFPSAAVIHVVEDPVTLEEDAQLPDTPRTIDDGTLRLGFISRISPMKNLDGLLRMLGAVSCRAKLDIFGPIEDRSYWRLCENLIGKLPPNVTAVYKGPLAPDEVSRTFATYDLFPFPTLGESFGHVVFEALRVGTPVLLSDRTPWTHQNTGAITVLSLEDPDGWRAAFHQAARRTPDQRNYLRQTTRVYAETYARNSGTRQQNLAMFEAVARRNGVAGLDDAASLTDEGSAGR